MRAIGHGFRRAFSSSTNLKKTGLYDFHKANGGKMVDFAGYALPVQYSNGVKQEHLAVRNECGLFDVSHMGQVDIIGKDRNEFIQRLTPVALDSLSPTQASLSVLMNKEGGILDDTVITKFEDKISMVVNGACKESDLSHMKQLKETEFSSKEVEIKYYEDKSLLALQGPQAANILTSVIDKDLSKLGFMFCLGEVTTKGGIDCVVTRCGYTGEDGFEISVATDKVTALAEEFVSTKQVSLCGLASRDSLRLEAGLCLYGNDLDTSRSVIEGSLLWVVNKTRRDFSLIENHFLGWERVRDEIAIKPKLKRAGFVVTGGRPVRGGEDIFCNETNEKVGVVTSGTFSVVLEKGIAMGYIERGIKLGTEVHCNLRGKRVGLKVTKMPFVPANYYRV